MTRRKIDPRRWAKQACRNPYLWYDMPVGLR
jgi:hypothetical protein